MPERRRKSGVRTVGGLASSKRVAAWRGQRNLPPYNPEVIPPFQDARGDGAVNDRWSFLLGGQTTEESVAAESRQRQPWTWDDNRVFEFRSEGVNTFLSSQQFSLLGSEQSSWFGGQPSAWTVSGILPNSVTFGEFNEFTVQGTITLDQDVWGIGWIEDGTNWFTNYSGTSVSLGAGQWFLRWIMYDPSNPSPELNGNTPQLLTNNFLVIAAQASGGSFVNPIAIGEGWLDLDGTDSFNNPSGTIGAFQSTLNLYKAAEEHVLQGEVLLQGESLFGGTEFDPVPQWVYESSGFNPQVVGGSGDDLFLFRYSIEYEFSVGWWGGWSFYDSQRKRRFIRDSRKVVYENSQPQTGGETFTELSEREFLFQPFVSLAEDPFASTSYLWTSDSWNETRAWSSSPWVEESARAINPVQDVVDRLARNSLVDQTIPEHRPIGDFPLTNTTLGTEIAWNNRDIIGPYGFDAEKLKGEPAGVQIVGRATTTGLEHYGMVGPNRIRPDEPPFEVNNEDYIDRPTRARRGIGSDHWDWLPRSARHVFMARQPYAEFANSRFSIIPWSLKEGRTAFYDPVTARRPWSNTPFESTGGLRQPVRALVDIAEQDDGHSIRLESRNEYRTRLETDRGVLGNVVNSRGTAILASGGLWIGANSPSAFNIVGGAPSNPMVIMPDNFEHARSSIQGDEWCIEVNIDWTSVLTPSPEIKDNAEIPVWSTFDIDGEDGFEGLGEIRPNNGLMLTIVPRVDSFFLNLYLVEGGTTSPEGRTLVKSRGYVLTGQTLLDRLENQTSTRVTVSCKGSKIEIQAEASGTIALDDQTTNLGVSPAVDIGAAFQALASLSGVVPSAIQTQIDSVIDLFYGPLLKPEGWNVEDAAFALVSITGTREFDSNLLQPTADKWLREGTSESRVFNYPDWVNPTSGRLLQIREVLEDFGRDDSFDIGLIYGGLAFHDESLTDIDNLNIPTNQSGGLNWSGWLSPNTRQATKNVEEVYGGRTTPLRFAFPASNYQVVDSLRDDENVDSLGNGVLLAQWRGAHTWSNEWERTSFADKRVWGFPVTALRETVRDLRTGATSPFDLKPTITGVTTPNNLNVPSWSSWGVRVESFEHEGQVRSQRLRSDSYQLSDLFLGRTGDLINIEVPSPLEDVSFNLTGETYELARNCNLGIWLTINNVERVEGSTAKSWRLFGIERLCRVVLVSRDGDLFVRYDYFPNHLPGADTGEFDNSTPLVGSVEIQVPERFIGQPLFLSLSNISWKNAEKQIKVFTAPETLLHISLHNIDGVQEDAYTPLQAAKFFENQDIMYDIPVNPLVTEIGVRDSWSNMLKADVTIGGIEFRRFGFDGLWFAVADQTTPIPNTERLEPSSVFFDKFFDPDPALLHSYVPYDTNDRSTLFDSDVVSMLRFPLLQEWCVSRAGTLWGYTGQTRVLPDHYGVTSVDGVGIDLHTKTLANLLSADGFDEMAHPSLFWARQGLAYDTRRVAAYVLREADRPHLWESFDRRFAAEHIRGVLLSILEGGGLHHDDGSIGYTGRESEVLSSLSLLRKLWYTRGISSPVSPQPEIAIKSDDTFGGIPYYGLYTPAWTSEGWESVVGGNGTETELKHLQEGLEGVVDRIGPPPFGAAPIHFGNPDNAGMLEGSLCFCTGNTRRYGTIDFQRLRNESFPLIAPDGSNVLLVSAPAYRDEDRPQVVRVATPKITAPESSEHTVVGQVEYQAFPTLMLKVSGSNLDLWDTSDPSDPIRLTPRERDRFLQSPMGGIPITSNILGNLCLERAPTLWAVHETKDERLFGGEYPRPFRVRTVDSELTVVPDRNDVDLQKRVAGRVWRSWPAGRQLLRKDRSDDLIVEGSSSGSPALVGPPVDNGFYIGKGRKNKVRSIWATTTADTPLLDSLPPDPILQLQRTQQEKWAWTNIVRVPDITSVPRRMRREWFHKFMQQSAREFVSGSASPINSALSGMTPYPSALGTQGQGRIAPECWGAPRWNEYSKRMEREFAELLQVALHPNGNLNEELDDRRFSPWIELTTDPTFRRSIEFPRPEGGWGSKTGVGTLLPWFRNLLLSAWEPQDRTQSEDPSPTPSPNLPALQRLSQALSWGKLRTYPDQKTSFPSLPKLEGVAKSIRFDEEPSRYFERELFDGSTDTVIGTLIDRYCVFDDTFPVANVGYNSRWPRAIMTPRPTGDDGAVTDGDTVTPLAMQRALNRYSRDSSVGYLRDTLANPQTKVAFLKVWYGIGDNLRRADYPHWWRGLGDFIFRRRDALASLQQASTREERGAFESYQTEWSEGNEGWIPFEEPRTGREYGVFHEPQARHKYVTSHRPYGPDVRTSTWENSGFWSRDFKLSPIEGVHEEVHDMWSLRTAYPHEFQQRVEVKPRGWRYGLMNVQPVSDRWVVNPRRWGQANDIATAQPCGRKTGGDSESLVRVELRNDSTSRNKDEAYRSFAPWVEYPPYQPKAEEVAERLLPEVVFPDIVPLPKITLEQALNFQRTVPARPLTTTDDNCD